LKQETNYPWDGKTTITIDSAPAEAVSLALRIPTWCRKWSVSVNGTKVHQAVVKKGYVYLNRIWRAGDQIELNLDMQIERIQAHPQVRAAAGKIAIQRGPLVYCLEEVDNGGNLSALSVNVDDALWTDQDDQLPDGTVVIRGKAARICEEHWGDGLYQPVQNREQEVSIKAIPYFLWGNREQGEMLVWIRMK
jgi:hypothetical protein